MLPSQLWYELAVNGVPIRNEVAVEMARVLVREINQTISKPCCFLYTDMQANRVRAYYTSAPYSEVYWVTLQLDRQVQQ